MKEKRHRFTHPDPEKKESPEAPETENKKTSPSQRDLKNSFVFIAVFLVLLAVLYFIDGRLNLMEYLKNLL